MKWAALVLILAFAVFWCDTGNEYSKRAHLALNNLMGKKAEPPPAPATVPAPAPAPQVVAAPVVAPKPVVPTPSPAPLAPDSTPDRPHFTIDDADPNANKDQQVGK